VPTGAHLHCRDGLCAGGGGRGGGRGAGRREKDEAYLQGGYPLQTFHVHLRICFMRHIVKNNFVSLSNKQNQLYNLFEK
jgi:hypothetical protein